MRVPDQTRVAEAIGETLFSILIGASPKISASFDSYHKLCNSEYRKIRIALHLPLPARASASLAPPRGWPTFLGAMTADQHIRGVAFSQSLS